MSKPEKKSGSVYWDPTVTAKTKDGQSVAITLGWPRESMGLLGATSAMLDLGAPWRQLDSMLSIVQKREDQADACARHELAQRLAADIAQSCDS